MEKQNGLTTFMVKELIYTWFRKLDDHAPVEEVLEMLDHECLEMKFPEATLTNTTDFEKWYRTVLRKFFDEVHDMEMLDVEVDGDMATVRLVVNWQARTWVPSAAHSEWVGVHAHQTWEVGRDPASGRPIIRTYHVDRFEHMEGSLKI